MSSTQEESEDSDEPRSWRHRPVVGASTKEDPSNITSTQGENDNKDDRKDKDEDKNELDKGKGKGNTDKNKQNDNKNTDATTTRSYTLEDLEAEEQAVDKEYDMYNQE